MRDREREITQTIVGKSAMADKQTKYSFLSGDERLTHKRNSDDRPIHPDQTKEVKDENSKIWSQQTL